MSNGSADDASAPVVAFHSGLSDVGSDLPFAKRELVRLMLRSRAVGVDLYT